MEEAVEAALEEVAFEGRNGCSVSSLWQLLVPRLPLGGYAQLAPSLKAQIWRGLAARPNDVTIHAVFDGPREEGQDRKRVVVQLHTQAESFSKYSSYSDAEAAGVHLLASEHIRFAVLGLFDAQESRFQLSAPQILTLELIGKTRSRGAVQSDLAIELKIAHRNFFYVTKHLQSRGLIAKNPVMVPGSTSPSQHMTTNILHLRRFAPKVKLAPGQVFKIVPNDAGRDGGSASYTIYDDAPWLKQVCDVLASTEERVVKESDLKLMLGFRMTKGHRNWRRIKQKLENAGYIECFTGAVNNKACNCVRLIKDFKPESLQPEDDVEEEDDEENAAGSMLVEVSLDRQMLEMVVQAGTAGITNVEVFNALKMNGKVFLHRMSDVVRRYGLTTKVENVGKSILNRLYAPARLLAPGAATSTTRPQVQRRSFLAKNISLTMHQGVVPLPAIMPEEPTLALPAPTAEGAKPAGGTGLAVVGHEDPASGTTAVPAQGEVPASVEGVDAAAPEAPGTAQDVQLGNRRRHRGKDYRNLNKARIPTSLSDDRMRRIEERLAAQGFVIRHEMRSYLHNHETETGLLHGQPANYRGPDRKTLERLVQRVENTGKARRVMVTLPPTISGGLRTVEAILRKDLPFNAEMEETIRSYTQQFDREIRQKCGRMRATVTPDIPVVENVAQLRPRSHTHKVENPDSPEAQVEMVENGFISAKMLRARLLHYLICKLVGLGGYQPVQLGPEASVPGMRLPGYTQTLELGFHHPAGVFQFANKQKAGVPPPPKAARVEAVKVTVDDKLQHAFTLKQLWEAMPMTLALQVVGTRKKVPGLLERCKVGEVVGELDEAQRAEIFDKYYTKRLIILLDVLKRMQLLDLMVKNSWDTMEQTGVGTFYARTEGELQAPVHLEKKPAGEDAPRKQVRRRGPGKKTLARNPPPAKGPINGAEGKSQDKDVGENEPLGEGAATQERTDKARTEAVPSADRHVEKQDFKYDLTKGEELDAFWMKMELIFSHDRISSNDPRLSCFPCTVVPEMLSKKVWQSLRLMSTVTWLHLQQRLEEEKDALDWQKCQLIADELNVSYQQVLRASYEKRRRCRLEMLRSGQLVPSLTPGPRKEKQNKPRPSRMRNSDGQPMTGEERAERVKLQAARYRQKQKERKRKLKEKQRSLLSGSTRDRMLKSSTHLFDDLQVGAGDGDWTDGATEVDASGLPMRLETMHKRRFVAAQRSWTLEDDKKLLHTYVKWRVLHRNSLTWAKMPGWPASPRQCQQRIFFMLRKQGALTRQLRVLCDQLRQHLLQVNKAREEAAPRPEGDATDASAAVNKRPRRGFASTSDVKNLLAGQNVEVHTQPETKTEDHQGLEDQWQQLQARPGDERSEGERAAAVAREEEDDIKSRQMLAEILSTADELMHTFPRNHRLGIVKPSLADTTRAEVLEARARMAQRQREAEAAAQSVAMQDEWLDDVQDDRAMEDMLESTGVISSARQLLQQWHARSSVGSGAAEKEEDLSSPPSDQVLAAMDFIRSLLYTAHKQPPLPVEAANMLLQVLPAADVWNALQRLQKLGCFNRYGIHAYKLSRQFLLALTHTGFEEELFPLAYEASLHLSQQTSNESEVPGFSPLDWTQCDGDEVGWCIDPDAAVEGAVLAEMLSYVAASNAKITFNSTKYQVGKKLQSRLELHQVALTNDPVKLEAEIKITWSTPYDQQRRKRGKKGKKGQTQASKPSSRIHKRAQDGQEEEDVNEADARRQSTTTDGRKRQKLSAAPAASSHGGAEPAAEGAPQGAAAEDDTTVQSDDAHLNLKPWLDYEGNVNTLYLEAIVKKIIALATHQPGTPLEQLLHRMQHCVSAQNGALLVQALVETGCLREEVRLATPSFIPRLLRSSTAAHEFSVKKFIFPTTTNTFSCWKIAETDIIESLLAASATAEG